MNELSLLADGKVPSANKANGLHEYVNAREEERVSVKGGAPKHLPTQLESLLSEIPSLEIRQAMRNEIERRRTAEQEVKIIKAALNKIPQIDVNAFLGGRITSSIMDDATRASPASSSPELQGKVKNFVERLTRGDLRRMGMKNNGGDIISMNNAPVVFSDEIKALVELAGLPSSYLRKE